MNIDPFATPARLFKTLGHPARLAILDMLRDGEQCVCHLEATLGYRQAYISQNLMILREAGLVQDRRDGLNIFYAVVDPGLFRVIDAALPAAPGKTRARRRSTACDCPKCQPVGEAQIKPEVGKRVHT